MTALSSLRNWGWGKMENSFALKVIRKWPSFCFRPSAVFTSLSSSIASDHQGSAQGPPLFMSIHPWFSKAGVFCFLFFFWLCTLHWKELRPLPEVQAHTSTFDLLFWLWGSRLCHVHVKIPYSDSKGKGFLNWELRGQVLFRLTRNGPLVTELLLQVHF